LSAKESPDFEEFLNRLDPLALSYLDSARFGHSRRKARDLALSSLRTFIREKCLNLVKTDGPFDTLVASLTENTRLVSFNWDVLLECALSRAGQGFTYLSSELDEDKTLILKPHGSINWFALLDRAGLRLYLASNLRPIGAFSNYMLYVTEPTGKVEFGSSEMVRRALSQVPAIVPPAAWKLISVGGAPADGWVEAGHVRVMKEIWAEVIGALDEAKELVVIGYSLPGTDAASIEALKSFANAKSTKRIRLVEPNAKIAERYRDILGIDADIVCSDFMNFNPNDL
jgi:hypothetical protein